VVAVVAGVVDVADSAAAVHADYTGEAHVLQGLEVVSVLVVGVVRGVDKVGDIVAGAMQGTWPGCPCV
jgi:hypothetical protein